MLFLTKIENQWVHDFKFHEGLSSLHVAVTEMSTSLCQQVGLVSDPVRNKDIKIRFYG